MTTSSASYLQLPLAFVANDGQASASAQFVAQGQGYGLSLNSGGAALSLSNGAAGSTASTSSSSTSTPTTANVVTMTLVGADPSSGVQGVDQLPGKVNYFLGSDPSQWRTDVSTFAKVQYTNVYPAINIVYYGNQGQLEYDFIVNPGANPNQIVLHYDGVQSMQLDSSGDLVLGTSGGNVVLQKPTLYQSENGVRQSVQGSFLIQPGGNVQFTVGSYDRSQPLVIDPILVYSTYFGGTGDDQALAVAVDNQGAAYFTGATTSPNLATTASSVAPASFISDMFKSSDSGGTWKGAGNGLPNAEFAKIVVDPKNSSIIYATTQYDVNGFPSEGIFKSTDGGKSWNPINTGLTSTDTGALAIDPVNTSNLFVAAGAIAFRSTDGGGHWTPITNGLPTAGGGIAAFAVAPSNPQIVYLDFGGFQLYKSTDGGSSWAQVGPSHAHIKQIIVDPTDANTIYYAISHGAFPGDPDGGVFKSTDGGQTINSANLTSTSFPFDVPLLVMDPAHPQTLYAGVSTNGNIIYKTTNGGAFWTKLPVAPNFSDFAIADTSPNPTLYVSTTDKGILESTDGGQTFVSSNLALTSVSNLAVDPENPTTIYAATRGRPRTVLGTLASDAFVAKLSPDGKSFDYITYLGGVGNDVGRGIAVDGQGNAYVGGITVAGGFPTTPGAFQATTQRAIGDSTGFVTELNPTGSGLIYSTYFGGATTSVGSIPDEIHGLALNSQNQVIVTGQTASGNFPTTPNAYQTALSGFAQNAFVSVLSSDGKSLVYSTYLGGGNDMDEAEAVAVDKNGNIYVTGSTGNQSGRPTGTTAFPVTAGAFQSSVVAVPGGFFSELDPNASGSASLLYSTVLNGTTSVTTARAVAVDSQGRAYVTGNTLSTDFPIRDAFQPTYGGDDAHNPSMGDAFVTVFDPTLSGNASLLYSTYLGGAQGDIGYGITIDKQGLAVVTGTTLSTAFPSTNAIESNPGGQAAFVARLDTSKSGASSLVDSTFLGGSQDHAEGHGLAVDPQGNVYVAGFTSAADFQTLGPAQSSSSGGIDGFVAKFSPAAGSADLIVAVTASPDPVKQGDNITYTITVTNNGPDAASGVYLSDRLDTGTTFVSASLTPSSQGNGAVGFTLGGLANGASEQVLLTVRVDSPSFVTAGGAGQSHNTVMVSGDRSDPNTNNNTFTYIATVAASSADIALTVTPVPGPILVGQDFDYKIVVTNNGPDDALNVVLTENPLGEVTFDSATPSPTTNVGNILTFNLGSIANGASKTVFVHLTPLVGAGSFLTNIASVATTSLDNNSKNNSSNINTVVTTPDTADLSVVLTGPAFSVASDGLSYTATITDNGPHSADNVIFTGGVSALATITSLTSSVGTVSQTNNEITAQLGTLAVGQSATITVVVNAPANDFSVTINATAKADEKDPDPSNNSPIFRTKVGQGAVTFTVTNTNDSGPGSLRQAIMDSEAQGATLALPNHIVFAIPETDSGKDAASGAFILRPLSPLPPIFTPTVVDGYTEPGASANTNPIDQADNAHIRIVVDGSLAGRPANGFIVYANNCVFRGLAINRFITKLQRGTTQNLLLDGAGIFLFGNNATIAGCFIGTDATGTIAEGNEVQGIALFSYSNTIGGTSPADRNLISGNGGDGVGIASGLPYNVIEGNFIGTDVTGAKALPTNLLTVAGLRLYSTGILAEGYAGTIGGTSPEDRNVISGNAGDGLAFMVSNNTDPRTSGSLYLAEGNYVGTDLTGTKAIPNGGDGIDDISGTSNTIGGTAPGARNIVSGNDLFGVAIRDAGNLVMGNYIGTDVTGTKPLGNGFGGVTGTGAKGTIGGSAPGAGNIIAGNNGPGVLVNQLYNVQGNAIGVDANGNPLGNNGDGIGIHSGPSTNNTGGTAGQGNNVSGNTIAYNVSNGITVTTTDSSLGGGTGNSFLGNSIYSNGELGIDLGADGVTPNHAALVSSPGANHLQNYPVLTSAISSAGTTTVQGTLAGLANRGYTLDIFASPYLNASGFGDGKTSLGQVNVLTDATGNVTFSTPFSQDLGGQYITATATTPNPGGINTLGSDTSEFSLGILVTGAPPVPPPTTSADLAISSQVMTTSPIVGANLTYQFTVTNNGPDPALVADFTHTLPTGVTFVSADSTEGAATYSASTNVVTCNFGTMPSNSTQAITVVVIPTVAGSLSGAASVSGLTPDPLTSNNSVNFQTTIGAGSLQGDVAVSMVASPDPIAVGGTLLYTITIINNGPQIAKAIQFSDTLPTGVTFLPDQSSNGLNNFSNVLGVLVGALAPGDSVDVFVAVQPTVAGSLTNTVTVTPTDNVPANNTASVTVTVLKSPSVTVEATSQSPSTPQQPPMLTVSVTSPTIGTPAGAVVFSEGNTILATKTLDSSGKATYQASGLSAGTHTILASYTGNDTFSPSSMSIQQVVTGAAANTADLNVRLQAAPNPVIVGSNISYTATITNNGPSSASNVVITASLPPGNIATYVSSSASQGSTRQASGTLTATLGSLAAGASATVTIVVTPGVAGAVTLSASASATETDPNPNNNSGSASANAVAPSTPHADLAVAISASRSSVAQGQNVALNLIVANLGPNDATGVSLYDAIPSGLTFLSTSQGTQAGGIVTIPVGSLAAGASQQFTIVVQATGNGPLYDAARVLATSPADLNPSNNTAAVIVTSNPPTTVNKTIDLVFGTISPLSELGMPSEDAMALSAQPPADIIDAILGQSDLDPRVIVGLKALRATAPAGGGELAFFNAVNEHAESTFAGVSVGASATADATATLERSYASYLELTTLGGGQIIEGQSTPTAPVVLNFPELSPASSGRVVNGQLTVRLIVQDATIKGPIGTKISLSTSQSTTASSQPLELSASVSGNPSVHPGTSVGASDVISFFDGLTLLGTAPVDASGKASLVVSTLTSGPHALSAYFAGTSLFASSQSPPVSVLVGSLHGPRVTSVQRFGYHRRPTSIQIHFDKALAPSGAENPANYLILPPGTNRLRSANTSRAMAIASIQYDPTTFTVTLHPVKRISLWHPYELIVRGSTPGSVSALSGPALEGKNGVPGTDYTTILTHATWVAPLQYQGASKKVK
jgi:uncharacterized repeat protein (TIGR01451 family)